MDENDFSENPCTLKISCQNLKQKCHSSQRDDLHNRKIPKFLNFSMMSINDQNFAF